MIIFIDNDIDLKNLTNRIKHQYINEKVCSGEFSNVS